jgi:hypothetical protein
MSFHVASHFNLYNKKYISFHIIMQVKIQIKMWIAIKQESQKKEHFSSQEIKDIFSRDI